MGSSLLTTQLLLVPMFSTVVQRAFAVRWAGWEPMQGGGVMPIRIRSLDYGVLFTNIGGVLYG